MDNNTSETQQEARTTLRESFLTTMNKLQGHPCNIMTYEKTMLHATFAGWKPDGKEVLVRDLKTPANISMQSALLRTPDILSIQFDNPVELP